MKIVVVGGGIVGLNTSLYLQKEFRNANITIVAVDFEDIVSRVAAGIFRVGSSYFAISEKTTRKLVQDSYEFYDEVSRSPDAAYAGVSHVSGYMFSNSSESSVRSKWLEGLVPIYRRTTPQEFELVGGDWKYGSFYETLLTSPSLFLPWAKQKLKENGATFKIQTVDSLKNLIKDYDMIINCSGLGAQKLCNDTHLVPIKGQVIKVKAPWINNFFYGEYDTYVIPDASGVVTLGGCRHFDSSSLDICPYDEMAIQSRCQKLLPSLSRAVILKNLTGLRPHRGTGVRIEMEKLSDGFSSVMVIHNYGHGGYGVCTAPGTGKYVTTLVREAHRLSKAKL